MAVSVAYIHSTLLTMYIFIDTHVYPLQVNSVSWNDSGSRLISGSDDCHLNIYDIATGLVRI